MYNRTDARFKGCEICIRHLRWIGRASVSYFGAHMLNMRQKYLNIYIRDHATLASDRLGLWDHLDVHALRAIFFPNSESVGKSRMGSAKD